MTHIQQRRDTAATWTSVNPILYEGEAGHETDTGKWKLGDGSTAWNALPYKSDVDSVAGKTGVVTLEVADIADAAPIDSPVFTGNPTAPTPPALDNDSSLATTGWVQDRLEDYAPVESPAFTGEPSAPSPPVDDDSNRLSTTGYVQGNLGAGTRLAPGFDEPVSIDASGDYNSVLDSGWYTVASGATNAPLASICYLEVRSYSTDYVEQVARPVGSTTNAYRRKRVAGTWEAWRADVASAAVGGTGEVGNIVLGSGIVVAGEGVWAERVNETVTLFIYVTSGTGTNPVLSMPPGFLPKRALRGVLNPTVTTARAVLLNSSGVLTSESGMPAALFGSLTYVAARP